MLPRTEASASRSASSGRSDVSEPDRIPRRPGDEDYDDEVVEARRALCRDAAGRELPYLFDAETTPAQLARGNVENFVGWARVPLGIAGPLDVDTSDGRRRVLVPLATNEGALVASYSRGMRLANAGGGVRARVRHEGLTQDPVLVYADAAAAARAEATARGLTEELAGVVRGLSDHGRLTAAEYTVVGRRLFIRLVFTTGDAIGINMAAQATDRIACRLAEATGAEQHYVHGEDVEKRANQAALLGGRGRSVVCDVTVPRAELERLARVTPEDLTRILATYRIGFARLGTQNWMVQSANGLAALMIACGQDVAYVTEGATGFLDLDVTAAGDLYASATLPALLLGTVGGGSGKGTAAECLALLGCTGDGSANRFAEIVAAALLCGDLSLMASFCAHEFVAAHERLGRNRPASDPSGERP